MRFVFFGFHLNFFFLVRENSNSKFPRKKKKTKSFYLFFTFETLLVIDALFYIYIHILRSVYKRWKSGVWNVTSGTSLAEPLEKKLFLLLLLDLTKPKRKPEILSQP